MNEPGPVTSNAAKAARPVFISFSSRNQKHAVDLCAALEARGTSCWMSCRDVGPGENYQESIVRAIAGARAVVLVFSKAANSSDEIKKELSLASRYRIPVLVVRIEHAQPTDAFAYELSTRQWIDAFHGWEKAIDRVVGSLDQLADGQPAVASPARFPFSGKTVGIAASLALAFAWWTWLRPQSAGVHTMQVRLAGFQRLSPDLPATVPAAMDDEIDAAFNNDGIITVSRASSAPPGNSPAYSLTGTIQHEGDKIKVISRLTNERSGVTLFSDSSEYPADPVRLPHWAAGRTSLYVRMGLFGASTYPHPLSDQALTYYFQALDQIGAGVGAKGRDTARKLVALVPDFSWGWSALELGARAIRGSPLPSERDAALKEALQAADRALAIDPKNGEAYAYKSTLVDPRDLVEREKLLKAALGATPLPCGCEHHFYGDLLADVGRTKESTAEYGRAVDAMSFNENTQVAYGQALLLEGRAIDAKVHFDAGASLDPDPSFQTDLIISNAPLNQDYAAALRAIVQSKKAVPPIVRRALTDAFRALTSGHETEREKAAQELAALPDDFRGEITTSLIGALGARALAVQQLEQALQSPRHANAAAWLWYPAMAGALRDPGFPAVAQRLGLLRYWKTTHTKPDVCSAKDPPPFCRLI